MRERNSWRSIGRAAGVLLAALWLYGAAGALAALVPVQGAAAGPREIAVWVEDNGIHTGIVFPKALLDPDLVARFAAADLRDPAYAGHDYLAIGWGDRAFFIETPRWRDVRPSTVLAAALGSDETVLHVEHVARPKESIHVSRVMLDAEGFALLTAYLQTSLREGEALPGYEAHDAFYPASGRYSAIVTCNEWTGAALRRAGVPMGAWTPFSGGVMRWL
ncbi:DUF2459 domain-containing protein [Sphingomonas sp.]